MKVQEKEKESGLKSCRYSNVTLKWSRALVVGSLNNSLGRELPLERLLLIFSNISDSRYRDFDIDAFHEEFLRNLLYSDVSLPRVQEWDACTFAHFAGFASIPRLRSFRRDNRRKQGFQVREEHQTRSCVRHIRIWWFVKNVFSLMFLKNVLLCLLSPHLLLVDILFLQLTLKKHVVLFGLLGLFQQNLHLLFHPLVFLFVVVCIKKIRGRKRRMMTDVKEYKYTLSYGRIFWVKEYKYEKGILPQSASDHWSFFLLKREREEFFRGRREISMVVMQD